MAAKKDPEPVQTYIVREPVMHDGERYAEGDRVELTAKQAKALIRHNAIRPEPIEALASEVKAPDPGNASTKASDAEKK